MTLPDTAEYWADVQRYFREKHYYTHAEGVTCGHHHVYDTFILNAVDCHACKRILTTDPDLRQKLTRRHKEAIARRVSRRIKHIRRNRYPAPCADCTVRVPAQSGYLFRLLDSGGAEWCGRCSACTHEWLAKE